MVRRIIIFLAILASAWVAATAQVEFKRGLEQISFIPKGQWITGVSVSYSQSNQDKYQFLIIENMSGDTYTFKVSPMLLYCFQDNLAAGGKDYTLEGIYNISHNYSALAAFRNYISLGRSRRFGFFNEVQLQVGGSESKLCSGRGDDLTGTFERSWNINVGLAPGMVMFLNNYSAIEVNVGVLGFSYSRTKATTDQIYVAGRDSKRANFKVNLFSIMFGVAFYL